MWRWAFSPECSLVQQAGGDSGPRRAGRESVQYSVFSIVKGSYNCDSIQLSHFQDRAYATRQVQSVTILGQTLPLPLGLTFRTPLNTFLLLSNSHQFSGDLFPMCSAPE